MTLIVGLDLSLASTGLSRISLDLGRVLATTTTTLPSKGTRADDTVARRNRINELANAIHAWTISDVMVRVDLAVVEGPSIMSKGGSNWDRAGLWWLVVSTLIGSGIPTAIAPPTVVKKFAAGKGNADKAAVAVGMARLWPEVNAANDNEWDALALATMGAQRLCLDVPARAHHRDALGKVAWPVGLITDEEPMRA